MCDLWPFFVAFSFALVACPSDHQPVTPMPPVVTDQGMCGPAGANLRRLGCPEGMPIDVLRACTTSADCAKGNDCSGGKCFASFEQFCVDTSNAGVDLFPGCLASITACSQVESCTPVASHKEAGQ